MLELCINANNLNEPGYIWHADDWTPIYPAVATDPAQVIGPWDNAWRLWQNHAAPDTYAVVGWLKRAENVDTFDFGTRFNPFSLRDEGGQAPHA